MLYFDVIIESYYNQDLLNFNFVIENLIDNYDLYLPECFFLDSEAEKTRFSELDEGISYDLYETSDKTLNSHADDQVPIDKYNCLLQNWLSLQNLSANTTRSINNYLANEQSAIRVSKISTAFQYIRTNLKMLLKVLQQDLPQYVSINSNSQNQNQNLIHLNPSFQQNLESQASNYPTDNLKKYSTEKIQVYTNSESTRNYIEMYQIFVYKLNKALQPEFRSKARKVHFKCIKDLDNCVDAVTGMVDLAIYFLADQVAALIY